MRRLPGWLLRPLERVVDHQRALQRRESAERAAREDAALRAYYADLSRRHDAGQCGGSAAGCPYVPCVPRVA